MTRGASCFVSGCSLGGKGLCACQLLNCCNCVLFCFGFFVISSHEPNIPPGAQLSLEIKLLEATDTPDLELLPPTERIALASLKRERGNVHYQRGDYAFAVNSYSIALQITESNSKGREKFYDTVSKTLCIMCQKTVEVDFRSQLSSMLQIIWILPINIHLLFCTFPFILCAFSCVLQLT